MNSDKFESDVFNKALKEEIESLELRRHMMAHEYLPPAIWRRGFEVGLELGKNPKRHGELMTTERLKDAMLAIAKVETEVQSAMGNWPAFNSAHEAYAVLLEEVDELKQHVWLNQKKRDPKEMLKEAAQVAAMAIRFMVDVCNEPTVRK